METRASYPQLSHHIMMIRPANFGYNESTAGRNVFQHRSTKFTPEEIRERASIEFDVFVSILERVGVKVSVFEDQQSSPSPDAVFSNNWLSFHTEGKIVLYPIASLSRRKERRDDIVEHFKHHYPHTEVMDYTAYEDKNLFLESTGSMVFDRQHRIAYACISNRTHEAVLVSFCKDMNLTPFAFEAEDEEGNPIYHTNVMMSVGKGFVVACLEAITSSKARNSFIDSVQNSRQVLIDISFEQMRQFAGNILHISNQAGKPFVVLSKRAHDSLTQPQLETLAKFGELLVIPIDIIEELGGGGVRCMMTEVFL